MSQEIQTLNFNDAASHVELQRNAANSYIVNPVRTDQNANVTALLSEIKLLRAAVAAILESGVSQDVNYADASAYTALSASGSSFIFNTVRSGQNVNITATRDEMEALLDLLDVIQL